MAEEFKGKHVVIFSRSCLLLSSEERQQQMNDEIDALSKNGNFKLHFTSHQNPTSEMLGAIPKGYVYYSHFRVLCWYQPFSRTRPQEPRSRPSYYNRGQKLWRLCASLHFTPNSISLTIGCTILEIPSSCAPPPPPPHFLIFNVGRNVTTFVVENPTLMRGRGWSPKWSYHPNSFVHDCSLPK